MSEKSDEVIKTVLNIFDFSWPFEELEEEYRHKIPEEELKGLEVRAAGKLPKRVRARYGYALITNRPFRRDGLVEYLYFLFLWLRGYGFVVAERLIFEIYLFRLTRLALEANPVIDLSAFQSNPLGSLPTCRKAMRKALGGQFEVICGKLDCIAKGIVEYDPNYTQDVEGLVCESLWPILADARVQRERGVPEPASMF